MRTLRERFKSFFSGNFAGILVVLLSSLLGLPVPFAAVHLLFINLVTDSLPAIALGLEPYKHNVMNEKPRPMNETILTKGFLSRVGVEGAVIGLITLGAFMIGYQEEMRNLPAQWHLQFSAFPVLFMDTTVNQRACSL